MRAGRIAIRLSSIRMSAAVTSQGEVMRVAGCLVGAGLIVSAAWCGGALAQTQDYPNKLVKFIVTYPPGGSSDVMARIIGQKLTEYWGQLVLVDSRPGADGS